MGEWERLGPSWWAYRRATQERPYGYALRQGWGVTLRPLCGHCRPLRLEGDEDEEQHEG